MSSTTVATRVGARAEGCAVLDIAQCSRKKCGHSDGMPAAPFTSPTFMTRALPRSVDGNGPRCTIDMTPLCGHLVRRIAMVFDRHLRVDRARRQFWRVS